MNSGPNEFRTRSTPCPEVAFRISAAKPVARESNTLIDSHLSERLVFGDAGRGEDLGARSDRKLNRRQADSARGGMDQHALT